MPDRTLYEPGTPCWADLLAPDPQALTGFYTGLFGWHADADAPGHTMFSLPDGRSAAALLPQPPATPPGTPAQWTVYFSVSDAEATAGSVRAAGGTVVAGPAEAGPLGWFAIVRDTEGAHLGLWRRAGEGTDESTGERPHLAGMVRMDEHWPAEVPAHWMIYFAVTDCDAAAVRAAELGGTVSVPPSDIPAGRFAVLGDPQGGFFSVIAPSGPGGSGE